MQRGTFPGISEAARFYRRKCEVDKIQNKTVQRWSKVKFGVVFDRCSQVFFEQEINKLILKGCLADLHTDLFGGISHIVHF